MPYCLRLGDWSVLVCSGTPDVELLLSHTGHLLHSFLVHDDELDKDITCLVIANPTLLGKSGYPEWLSKDQYIVWDELCNSITSTLCQTLPRRDAGLPFFRWLQPGYETIDRVGASFAKRAHQLCFVFLCDEPGEYSHIQLFLYLLLLANKWHIRHRGFCLHSAAIARGHKGFLFLGGSRAGKTTVSQLSTLTGYTALGDDLNFILRKEEDYVLAAAPSAAASMTCSKSRPCLQAIFNLVQDKKDFLIPLSPMQIARSLFEGLGQAPKSAYLLNQELELAFQTCCAIARAIPGYELHFRKSPDFWKLIDEQFPD